VQLLRSSDTRTPSPLLSTYIATTATTTTAPPPASLGKLADLRAMRGAAAAAGVASSSSSPSSGSGSGSWRVAGSGGNGSAGLSSTSSSSRPIAPVVGQRGWASVIAKQAGGLPLPAAATTVERPLSRSFTPLIGGSGSGSRTASPVPLPVESGPLKNVPDSWEDDA